MKSVEFYEIVNGLLQTANRLAQDNNQPEVMAYRDKVSQLATFVKDKRESNASFAVQDLQQLLSHLGEVRGELKKLKNHGASEQMMKSASEQLALIEQTAALMDVTENLSLSQAVDSTAMSNMSLEETAARAGANSSSRSQISIQNTAEKSVDGFFTPEEKLFDEDANKRISLVANEMLRKYPDNQALRKLIEKAKDKDYGYFSLISCMREGFKKHVPKDADPSTVDTVYAYSNRRLKERIFNPFKIPTDNPVDNIGLQEFLIRTRMAFSDKEVKKFGTQYVQYGPLQDRGILANAGSSVSGRNVAVSNVANILGVPGLVAKSIPMSVKEKGKDVSGVFMKKAVGVDYSRDNLEQTDFMLLEGNGFTGEGLKQLADLQVLDYLCQYVDRHQNNLLYSIQDGKIKGIQAIDNDTSFGTLFSYDDSNVQHGSTLHDISVISESMKNTISNLQPETLVAAISGLGLSDAEIRAAKSRLDKLKTYIATKENTKENPEAGSVKVIKEDEWKDLNVFDLAMARVERVRPDGSIRGNIFTRTQVVVTNAQHRRTKAYGEDEKTAIQKYKDAKANNKFAENVQNSSYAKSGFLDELSPNELKYNRSLFEKLYTKQVEGETKQIRKNPAYVKMKGALEAVLAFSHEKEMNQEERVQYNNALIKLLKAAKSYVDDCVANGIEKEGVKGQLSCARALCEFTNNHEIIFHQASLDKQEAELNEVYDAVKMEEKQYDQVVDVLAEKLIQKYAEQLPDMDKAAVVEMIKEGPVLRALLDEKVKEDNGKLRNNYKHYAELAATSSKKLVEDYVEKVQKFARNDYVDEMHKAVFDKAQKDKGIKVDTGELLFKDSKHFKELLKIQEKKYSIATDKVIKQVNKEKKLNPADLALVFAERIVINHLKALEDKAFNRDSYKEIENKVNNTDYEKEMEKIVADPVFTRISKELKAGECSVQALNKLFVKYANEKKAATAENAAQPGAKKDAPQKANADSKKTDLQGWVIINHS